MCIQQSVGQGGINAQQDVVIVQVLLNFNRPVPLAQLLTDGLSGPSTIAAIQEFQSRVLKLAAPDGRVDPNGRTLKALRAGLPSPAQISEPLLKGIMPAGKLAKIALYSPRLVSGMSSQGVDTALRQAHFLAQIGHESLSFTYVEEIASGEAYEGRLDLGNTQPGDGKRFKGRGLIQLTGRTNYVNFGTSVGRNLTDNDNPKLVATEADLAVNAAFWFWKTRAINAAADKDDLNGVTRLVNGGLNGLADRKAYLTRAKFFLGL